MTWVMFGALALAGVAIVGWHKARADAECWREISRTMYREYEHIQLELASRQSKVNVAEQKSQWLN